jgi:hypothetical protein
MGEIQAYLAGQRGGQPLLNLSCLAFAGPQLVSACLAGDWQERQQPIIAYVMTRAEWKGSRRRPAGAVGRSASPP